MVAWGGVETVPIACLFGLAIGTVDGERSAPMPPISDFLILGICASPGSAARVAYALLAQCAVRASEGADGEAAVTDF
jgi:hypothetical protein